MKWLNRTSWSGRNKGKKKINGLRNSLNVILWDDDDHSYEYVVLMMRQIFGHPFPKGFEIARNVDAAGRSVCLTTSLEHAELKQDQIHSFGRDFLIERCEGSMSASIEPVPGE